MAPSAILAARQLERVGRRAQRGALRLQRRGVELQRPQRVGDVLECRQHGAAILRLGLVVGGFGGALLVQQREAVENRLRAARRDAPDDRVRREQGRGGDGGAAVTAGESELRQPIGDGDADLGAGLVQLRLRGAHVGALLDELRRQAQRQIGRQPQRRQREVIVAVHRWGSGRSAPAARGAAARAASAAAAGRLRGRHFGLLGEHVGARRGADIELMLHDLELIDLRL